MACPNAPSLQFFKAATSLLQPSAHSTFNIVTQMVPLIKRSTDSLMAVIGEKATAEVTFEAIEYVCLITTTILLSYNIFYYKVQLFQVAPILIATCNIAIPSIKSIYRASDLDVKLSCLLNLYEDLPTVSMSFWNQIATTVLMFTIQDSAIRVKFPKLEP